MLVCWAACSAAVALDYYITSNGSLLIGTSSTPTATTTYYGVYAVGVDQAGVYITINAYNIVNGNTRIVGQGLTVHCQYAGDGHGGIGADTESGTEYSEYSKDPRPDHPDSWILVYRTSGFYPTAKNFVLSVLQDYMSWMLSAAPTTPDPSGTFDGFLNFSIETFELYLSGATIDPPTGGGGGGGTGGGSTGGTSTGGTSTGGGTTGGSTTGGGTTGGTTTGGTSTGGGTTGGTTTGGTSTGGGTTGGTTTGGTSTGGGTTGGTTGGGSTGGGTGGTTGGTTTGGGTTAGTGTDVTPGGQTPGDPSVHPPDVPSDPFASLSLPTASGAAPPIDLSLSALWQAQGIGGTAPSLHIDHNASPYRATARGFMLLLVWISFVYLVKRTIMPGSGG